ncbi:hypothetical protein EUTSA_v10029088mg [Eutrema salsugineum]|uniref:DUF1985 domain-containing protein n=1 Tax=Eutrema salsugineum TaxID=72664 RepID=V4N083_EUTSA|nr:hypothetical protein EUTSA_v10029088mg [Eutrema salsugineum]
MDNHTHVELLEVLKKTACTEDNKGERFSLAMLILIKTLLLPKYATYRFPKKLFKRAQNLELLLSYPWGRDSYMILLDSVQKTVPSWLARNKYDLQVSR